VELYLHPNTPSWRGSQLKIAQGQFYLYYECYFAEETKEVVDFGCRRGEMCDLEEGMSVYL
jgi:hypothetical protein